MIPQLNPADVNATGAYQLAMALAMVSMGIGAILRFLPSRKWKSEGRDLMKTAFEAVLLASSLLTVEFVLGYVKGVIGGYPDWPRLLEVVKNLAQTGWVTLNATAQWAFIFGLVVSALDILSKIVPVIATFVMHFFMAVAFSILSFFAALSVLLIVLSTSVIVIASMAAHAYLLVAAGIALFAWKHTRSLGISFLVFGVALFYGLPVMLGFVQPAEPYAASPDEEARAKMLLALTENSVPTKISVVSAGRKPLYFSYISMNSSVLIKDVPLNSTLIANITGGPLRNEKGDVTYHFVYGRFYNESYSRDIRCHHVEDPNLPVSCFDYGPDYSRIKELRHQLYRNSTVRYVWYLGLLLPVRDNRVQVSGPSLMKPLIEIPSNIFEIVGSLHKAFGGLRSEDEYWEMVYGRSKPVRIDVPVVRELNQNVTAFVLYNETNYRSWREVEGKREYTHNYTIPRVSEHCWVSRTEEYFDESCNCTRTSYYYKARAEYVYETPPDDRLVLVLLPGTKVVPKVVWHSEFGGPAQGKAEPIIYSSDPSYPKEKGLILGYQPLTLKFNQGIVEARKIPEKTNEAANVIKGNPGRGSGTTRELEEPAQKEVTLSPEIEVWEIGIRHTRTIETGEQEGSCPSTPRYIEAWSLLGFNVENSEPWDPYKTGIFRWGEYSKTGGYEYRGPKLIGDVPALGAYKPSDPRLVHRFYEEDPREPESNLKKYDAPLLMRFGTPISQMIYIGFATVATFAVADAVTGWLGGTSLGLVGMAKAVAGMGRDLKLFSPFGISRYPLFGKRMSERALKRIEDRIWGDVRQKLKDMEDEARRKKDSATLWALLDFYRIDRQVRRRFFGRKSEDLEKRRLEVLSRLLPDEAVILQELRRLQSNKRLTAEEAEALIGKVKEQAKSQLGRFWFLYPLAMMAHEEGRATLRSAFFGRLGGEVTRGWAGLAYLSPMARPRIGIDWVKVGKKEIPVPVEKGAMVAQAGKLTRKGFKPAVIPGGGFSYGIEHQKFALERTMMKPEELKMHLEEQLDIVRREAEANGEKVKDPVKVLREHENLKEGLREISDSAVRDVLEGRMKGELPYWNVIPVHHLDFKEDLSRESEVKYEIRHAKLDLRFDSIWVNDPKIELRRLEEQLKSDSESEKTKPIEIDGTKMEGLKLSDFFSFSDAVKLFSSAEEEKQAGRQFVEYAKDRTDGLGVDWAWYGKIANSGWIKPGERGDGTKSGSSPSSENGSGAADPKAVTGRAEGVAGELPEEPRSRDRTKDLWGDGE
jgi:hypothetical protein